MLVLSNQFDSKLLIRCKLAVGSSLLVLNGGYIQAQIKKEKDNNPEIANLQANPDITTPKDTTSHYCYAAVTLPEFPGGQIKMLNYLATEIKKYDYSESWKDGSCFVSFIIDKTGKVINPQIVHPLSSEQDTVSLRILKEMPLWKPGKIKEKLVNMKQTIPIIFSGYEVRPEQFANLSCYVIDDRFADYHGGNLNLKAYISQHATYPPYQLDVEGEVIVSFWIDQKGKTCEPQIIQSLHPVLDRVALKLIKEMPHWIPAHRRGKPIKSKHTLIIPFKRKL